MRNKARRRPAGPQGGTLPFDQTRRGATPMPDARLARPFTVFVTNGGGR